MPVGAQSGNGTAIKSRERERNKDNNVFLSLSLSLRETGILCDDGHGRRGRGTK